MRQLGGYPHDLWHCLFFQGADGAESAKTVILKPEWGTTAVYRVLDDPAISPPHGLQPDRSIWIGSGPTPHLTTRCKASCCSS